MRKINSMHIEYIFGCLEQNASRVRNIKKYLLTTLFNERPRRWAITTTRRCDTTGESGRRIMKTG